MRHGVSLETLLTRKSGFDSRRPMHSLDLDQVARWAKSSKASGARVEYVGPRLARVGLWGELPVGWAGRLARGLADAGVDIRRGEAKCNDSRLWLAEFELSAQGLLDLSTLDYLKLCRADGASHDNEALKLYHFELGRAPDGAALELMIRAPDKLGFLGRLLGHLAFFSLFPESMSVTSLNGTAHDWFTLRGVGGSRPSVHIEHMVTSSLSRYTSSAPRRSSTPPALSSWGRRSR